MTGSRGEKGDRQNVGLRFRSTQPTPLVDADHLDFNGDARISPLKKDRA
jgi:hypothetical protein